MDGENIKRNDEGRDHGEAWQSRRNVRGAPTTTLPAQGVTRPPDRASNEVFPPPLSHVPSSSWEEGAESHGGGRESRSSSDRRKVGEAETPTLLDDDYYEVDDLASFGLDEAAGRSRFFFSSSQDAAQRRTPGPGAPGSGGANPFYERDTRRTPGAGASSKSAALGFGLELSTPLGSGRRDTAFERVALGWNAQNPAGQTLGEQEGKTAPNPSRADPLSSLPWSLSRDEGYEANRDSVSPHTLRLTEDLGNLLLEDDEALDETSFDFGSPQRGGATPLEAGGESWTDPYVIGSKVIGSRSGSRASTRGRRRSDVTRKPKGQEPSAQIPESQSQTNSFDYNKEIFGRAQQPQPVRGAHNQSEQRQVPFTFGGSSSSPFAPVDPRNASPHLFGYSGAFAPPAGRDLDQSGAQSPFVPVSDAHRHSPFVPGPQFMGGFGAHSQGAFVPHGNPGFGAQTFVSPPEYMYPPPSPNFGFGAPMPFEAQGGMLNAQQGASQTPPLSHPSSHNAFGQPQTWQPRSMTPQHVMEGHRPSPLQFEPKHSEHQWSMPSSAHASYHTDRRGQTTVPTQGAAEASVSMPDMSVNPFAVLPEPSGRKGKAGRAGRGKTKGKARKGGSRQYQKDMGKSDESTRVDSATDEGSGAGKKAGVAGKKAATAQTKSKKKQSSGPSAKGGTKASGKSDVSDPTAAKRAEMIESPTTRAAFKDFYKKFRAAEKVSFKDAEEFAVQAMDEELVPRKVFWRVFLELADLAKRGNRFVDARRLYQKVCQLQPYASQGWLEYCKLEEECGNMKTCSKILKAGLDYCQYSETLLTRAIKLEEKIGSLSRARELLARLKHVSIDKVWRTVLEGALLEARAGNDVMARRVLKYLMHHVPWYGPLYLEAFRLEKDLGRPKEALEIVNKGLSTIPRYGPLWFGAFRLCELLDLSEGHHKLPRTLDMIDNAVGNISKELIWKVHLEAAQMLERSAFDRLDERSSEEFADLLDMSRKRFAMTILSCPPNLRWKVWLTAGRLEVMAGRVDIARQLFRRAFAIVPDKGRSVAMLECARYEEFIGDMDLAIAILRKCRNTAMSDWKVWYECVVLESRRGNLNRAVQLARQGLKFHPGTGRIWASLVQLCHFVGGEESQLNVLGYALNAVPKSGEVWCEASRIHLNPFSRTFDIERARRHLFFATRFTPQYGDGFIESLRLEILDQWIFPMAVIVWESTERKFRSGLDLDIRSELSSYICNLLEDLLTLARSGKDAPRDVSSSNFDREASVALIQRLSAGPAGCGIDLTKLQQRCANGDPNYGTLWFFCRNGPTDTARQVLAMAADALVQQMERQAHFYVLAMVRRLALLEVFERLQQSGRIPKLGQRDQDPSRMEEQVDNFLLGAPSLADIVDDFVKRGDVCSDDMDLLESTMSSSDYACAFAKLSKPRSITGMSLREKRKTLFGTDIIFS